MFITEEELKRRLESPQNLLRRDPLTPTSPPELSPPEIQEDIAEPEEVPAPAPEKTEPILPGNGKGPIPTEIRAMIATAAHIAPIASVAKTFGVSKRSVTNFVNGRLKDPVAAEELRDRTASMLERVQETALMKTMMAMGMITEKDMRSLKGNPVKLINLAMGFASIHDKVTPKNERGVAASTFVIFRGAGEATKTEEDYKVTTIDAEIVPS